MPLTSKYLKNERKKEERKVDGRISVCVGNSTSVIVELI